MAIVRTINNYAEDGPQHTWTNSPAGRLSTVGGRNRYPQYSSTNTPINATNTSSNNWNWGYDDRISNGLNTSYNYTPFSVADTLNQRQQAYHAQGLEGLANTYKNLNKENNIWNTTANKIADYYTAIANDINAREQGLANSKSGLANTLLSGIANQADYVNSYFGPNGIFTNEVNKYYDDAGNYLASEAGRQIAQANAEGIQSGASLGAQRAARNEAYNNAFQNYIKMKEQELTAKMNIQTQLINYMKALREEYGNTANELIIGQYQRANDLLNNLSGSLLQTQQEIQSARLNRLTTPVSSGSDDNITKYRIPTEDGGIYEYVYTGRDTVNGNKEVAFQKINGSGDIIESGMGYFSGNVLVPTNK